MKNKYIILICITTLLLGVAVAQLGLLDTSKNLSISKENLNLIKSTGIKDINIKVSDMICDNTQCWASIYQDNLIQTEFRIEKNYCSNANETSCIEYTDYTENELEDMRDAFILQRLNNYANSIKIRNENIKFGKIGGGIITINEK